MHTALIEQIPYCSEFEELNITDRMRKSKKRVAYNVPPSASLPLIPHFNVLFNLLLYRRRATWNLIVLQKWLRHSCVSSPIDHKNGPIKMRVQFSLLHEPKVNHAKLTSNLVSLLTNLIP